MRVVLHYIGEIAAGAGYVTVKSVHNLRAGKHGLLARAVHGLLKRR